MASDADRARSQPEELKVRLIEVVESVASTEEMVAATLFRLAKQEPHRAAHLRALSAQAGLRAARKRKWAKDHTVSDGAPGMNSESH
jgi:hypothetical protein